MRDTAHTKQLFPRMTRLDKQYQERLHATVTEQHGNGKTLDTIARLVNEAKYTVAKDGQLVFAGM